MLIVLCLSGLCHLLVFPTRLLGSCGSAGTERWRVVRTWPLGVCLVPHSCTAALGVSPALSPGLWDNLDNQPC